MHGDTVTELTDDHMDTLRPIVANVAHALARKYNRFMEAADIAQELWLWCLTRPSKVTMYLDREEPGERRAGAKAVQKSLYRAGDRLCRKEKAARSGYRVSDEFFYSKALIEALLIAKYNDGKLMERGVDTNVRVSKSLAEGGDVQAMIVDLEIALDGLSDDTRDMLVEHVVRGVSTTDLAEQLGVSRQAVDQRMTRAMDKMVDSLGGPSPYA